MNDLRLVFRSPKRCCHGNQFVLVLSAYIHIIGFASHSADSGVRQELQILCWTQANQLTDQLKNSYQAARGIAGRPMDRLCLASRFVVYKRTGQKSQILKYTITSAITLFLKPALYLSARLPFTRSSRPSSPGGAANENGRRGRL